MPVILALGGRGKRIVSSRLLWEALWIPVQKEGEKKERKTKKEGSFDEVKATIFYNDLLPLVVTWKMFVQPEYEKQEKASWGDVRGHGGP